jgi:ABC-type sugar transport system permease subunit
MMFQKPGLQPKSLTKPSSGRRFRLTLERRRSLTGYMFTLPLTIGFILFFLYPFILSISFSLSTLIIDTNGYRLDYIGLENYRYALMVNTSFVRTFVDTIRQTAFDVPLILGFSFFAAVLLNQKFRGRMLARVIFFLPVILGAGVVLQLEQTDYMTGVLSSAAPSSSFLLSDAALQSLLLEMKLPEQFLRYIASAVDYVPQIIKDSGIQILVFLAGLQSIPSSLYEAADVEGATGWESFWMVTFPLMSPLILTNVVYTVVDSFTAADNKLLTLIMNTCFGGAGYGAGTAMAWLYFAVILVVLGVVIGLISRYVFYQE